MAFPTRTLTFLAALIVVAVRECHAQESIDKTDVASSWVYRCSESKKCERVLAHHPLDPNKDFSLAKCKLTCGMCGRLWPKPNEGSGSCNNTGSIANFNPNDVTIEMQNENKNTLDYLTSTLHKYLDFLKIKTNDTNEARSIKINVDIENIEVNPRITRNTDERYKLEIAMNSDGGGDYIAIDIDAATYFGARHALDSLSQFWTFDEGVKDTDKGTFIVLKDIKLIDEPEFQHRGILLDTSRNFFPKERILNIIDGMSFSKLNVLHWHITDSHSFPIKLERYPKTTGRMADIGAYNENSKYTLADVREIVEHANINGIRVIPEFDSPAHVGFGWYQMNGWDRFTVCVDHQPWEDYCVEPPCGQLNPFSDDMYSVLNDLFDEYLDIFNADSFHVGGDEVNQACWAESQIVNDDMREHGFDFDLSNEEGFHKAWMYYHDRQLSILKALENDKGLSPKEYIIWTSGLTAQPYIDRLSPQNYTIQIWTDPTNMNDQTINDIVNNGNDMIFSNTDTMYLDCGYGAWVGSEGNNWCSPYKGWQQQYGNDPYEILKSRGFYIDEELKNRIRGSEAAMWSEQVDSTTVEGKLFPRISAVGERLWSGPNENWKNDYMEVEIRMVAHRQLLVDRGIEADALQPEYCLLSEGSCELHNFDKSSGGSITTSVFGSYELLISILLFKFMLFFI